MSAFKEALLSGLEEYLQRLQVAIEGLTPAEVRWQPTMQTNHIAWLVWHMARVEDSWVSRLLGGNTQVWTAEDGPTDSIWTPKALGPDKRARMSGRCRRSRSAT